ncbi:MAG: hypothetical protein OXG85_02670 [Chloroflexi bacterium]|nr:hypothetical protein [Chloroflexota bacterium]
MARPSHSTQGHIHLASHSPENRVPKMSLDDLLAYQGEEEEEERRA